MSAWNPPQQDSRATERTRRGALAKRAEARSKERSCGYPADAYMHIQNADVHYRTSAERLGTSLGDKVNIFWEYIDRLRNSRLVWQPCS